MTRLTGAFAPLGILAIVVKLLRPNLPGDVWVWVAVGLALMLTHLVLRWEDVLRIVGVRQLTYGANVTILAVLVLGIVVLLNYLANKYSFRWDLSKGARFSLAEQTRKILKDLKEDVKLVYVERITQTSRYQAAKDQLELFAEASPRVKVEYLDPRQDPVKTTLYEVAKLPTLVVEFGGRRERMNNDSEQDITNAIIKLSRNRTKVLCFLTGEGERDVDDMDAGGYSRVKEELTRAAYEVKKVPLQGEDKVPDDCTVIVLAGPQRDPLPAVIDRVRAFVQAGGKALILLEPDVKNSYPNVVALLKEWSIVAGPGVVVDMYGRNSGLGDLAATGYTYSSHPITKDLMEFDLFPVFLLARTIEAASPASPHGPPTDVRAQNLVETNSAEAKPEGRAGAARTWLETEVTPDRPVQFDAGKDRKGPLPLAAVATIRVAPTPAPSTSASPAASAAPSPSASGSPAASPSPSPSPEAKPREGRVVAAGDADFPANFMERRGANFDLFMNMVAWLAEDEDLISLRPKDRGDQRLKFAGGSPSHRFMSMTARWVVPGFFVVLGFVTWWRRR